MKVSNYELYLTWKCWFVINAKQKQWKQGQRPKKERKKK